MSVASDEFVAAIGDAVGRGDLDGVVTLIANAPEAVRRQARPAIVRKYEDRIYANRIQATVQAAGLALLGVATLPQIRLMFNLVDALAPCPEQMVAVVRARDAGFAPALMTHLLGEEWGRQWPMVRALITAGVVPRPTGPQYIAKMVTGISGDWENRHRVYDALLADPALLEDEVWDIFTVDVTNDLVNAKLFNSRPSQPAKRDENVWIIGLVRLAGYGHLSRERLLDASLDAMMRDFRPTTVSWHVHFHEALDPSVPERRVRLARYLALMDSLVSAVVGCGLAALRALESELDADTTARALPGPLGHRQKNLAVDALGLLDRTCKRLPEAAPELLAAAIGGLSHERVDVQERTLTVIERWWPSSPQTLTALIGAARDACSPTLQGRIDQLIGPPHDGAKEDPPGRAAADTEIPQDRVDRLPAAVASGFGVGVAMEALDSGAWPAPRGVVMTPELLRAVVPALTPVSDHDEALALAARLVEGEGNGDDAERLVDAVVRLDASAVPGFRVHASGVHQRALAVSDETGSAHGRCLIARLVAGWLGTHERWDWRGMGTAMAVLGEYVDLAADPSTRRPLLGTPTHEGGWIDRDVLRERRARRRWQLKRKSIDDTLAQSRATFGPSVSGESTFVIVHSSETWRPVEREFMTRFSDTDLPQALAEAAAEVTVPHTWWIVEFADDGTFQTTWKRVTWAALDALGARWLATVAPAAQEVAYAAAAAAVWLGLDANNIESRPDAMFEVSFSPLAGLGRCAWQALAHGLLAKSAAATRAATDVIVASIDDGRFDPAALAAALNWTFENGKGVLPRVVTQLRDVARLSDLHAAQVFRFGQQYIATAKTVDKTANPLLELMLETGVLLGASVTLPDARTTLEGAIASTGATSKLATTSRRLLALEPRPESRFDHARIAACLAVVTAAEAATLVG